MNTAVPFRRRLMVRVVVGLLLVSIVPLSVSFLLIGRIAEVAQNFSSHRVQRLLPHLERAQARYPELTRTKKLLFGTTTVYWAADPILVNAIQHPPLPADFLKDFVSRHPNIPDLSRIAILTPEGVEVSMWKRSEEAPVSSRELTVKQRISGTDHFLQAVWLADEAILTELSALAAELDTANKLGAVGGKLPASYSLGFVILVGGVVILVTAIGLILAIRIGRRIESLVVGTQRIGGGELSTRVNLVGGDELAYLSQAFNQMADHLEHDREQIIYLQRIGAWQEVARRLAHEIKNPLTPIRLAVQQIASDYKGDDERFRKQLKATEEIVNEEIDNLRRLVDAFTLLGRLPKVEPKPLDLEEVFADLEKDPTVSGFLERGSGKSVKVRGDRLLLRRVLTNLVENGHHAGVQAGRAGRVVVSWLTEPRQGRAVIHVDDEGEGISDSMRSRVFEPYFTTKDTGSGLGLAIAKKIAIDHGGGLEISPQRAPTGGARFVLSLPLTDGV